MPDSYTKPNHPLFNDLTGKRFDRLTVVEFRGSDKAGNFRWLVRCDCGNTKVVPGNNLGRRVRSCGCRRLENVTKHGQYHHRFYPTWHQMMARCYNSKAKDYNRYGGRGITVVPEWHDVKTFILWAEQHYERLKTIDRRDNDGPYSPENCRFRTRRQQANNTRKNIWFAFNGRTQTQAEWARELNLPVTTIFNRLHKLHWSIQRTLSTGRSTR